MDRYQRVEKKRSEEPIDENEIRITAQGLIRNYITYAISLLQEKQTGVIVLKAMGQAISKTVAIAEIIKKRIPGLHQETSISSMSITDMWEPMEEGLVPLEMTRQVSLISISLSTKELNKNSPGYQSPSEEQPKHQYQSHQQQKQMYAATTWGNEDSSGRGRVRGRGRGRGRGWGRTSYRNYPGKSTICVILGMGYGRGRGGGQSYGRGRARGRGRGWVGGRGRGRGQQA
ncbi:DNA/RNA-binding protein Alba-like protein [Corchorus capsularis]|uniref:DNA/RNA-binding protein Alba-like protein n=1 Tax=Corchorus capsularis TaxID=210143 RepID=A0A1R3G4S2_COCAP|nr:DNA/RNA-binding protein Alba-like protein [Corchorus capsularis]